MATMNVSLPDAMKSCLVSKTSLGMSLIVDVRKVIGAEKATMTIHPARLICSTPILLRIF